jgi:putative ABC transport system permease protein
LKEVALAFVLLISAGLMLQTLGRLLTQSPGFRTDNLLTFDLYRPALQSEADRKKDAAAQIQQTKDIVQQVQRLPGVEAVAAANYGLLDGTILVHGGLRVEGSDTVDPDADFAVSVRYVSPTYFRTLGVSLLRGREFGESDTQATSPVTIANERMARKYWGRLDVLGKRFSASKDAKGNEEWSEVVGVVTSAREFLVNPLAPP